MSPRTLRTQLRGHGRALPSSAEHGQQRWRLPLLGPWEGGNAAWDVPPQPVSGLDSAATSRARSCRVGKSPGRRIPQGRDGRDCGSAQGPPARGHPSARSRLFPFWLPGSLRGSAGTPRLSVPPGGGTAGAPTPACTGTRPSKGVSNGAGAQPERTQPREPPPGGLRAPPPGGLHRGGCPDRGRWGRGPPLPEGPARTGRERRGTGPVPGGAASPALPPPRGGAEPGCAEPG
ncbi:basic salivary proline-rich protein 4-like [Ammospiza nelsoni]|uniref:basic salivary proline-rich protein 4-like n=1 Tax=Ammospiza nelsoni TaxID=2857394 RepID=UPI00286B1D10|nr:basic salivary proline-rich protein 4-like [Ammospiza nelsoni]